MMEEPRELPEGWVWTKVGELSEIRSGYGFPNKYQGKKHDKIPFFKVMDISKAVLNGNIYLQNADNYISDTEREELQAELLKEGTIVFAKIGEAIRLNRRAILGQDSLVDNNVMGVYNSLDLLNNLYLFYFVLTIKLGDFSRATTVPSIRKTDVEQIPIPLPPLNEQRRIVAKLESLFSEVNTAREHFAKVPSLLKQFRQSVLAAACSGRLTEDWRREHPDVEPATSALLKHAKKTAERPRNKRRMKPARGLTLVDYSSNLPENWGWFKIRELVKNGAIIDVQDGNHGELYPRKHDFGADGIPYICAEHVFDDKVLIDEAPLLIHSKANKLRIGFVKPGDVILTHNATVGRVGIIPLDVPDAILSTSTTYYRVDENILKRKFLALAFRSFYFQNQLKTIMEQTTRNQVSVTKQVELSVQLPPVEEQDEIIRRVDALFNIIKSIEERYKKAITQVNNLTHSILAKAFRGELVPQDPNDESASVLLERIKKERAKNEKEKKVRTTKIKTLLEYC